MKNEYKPETQTLSALVGDVGTQLTEQYHEKMGEILSKQGLFDLDNDPPNPLEVWNGIVQAIADHSGYRVALQAGIFERSADDPSRATVVGHREIATVELTLWMREAPLDICEEPSLTATGEHEAKK